MAKKTEDVPTAADERAEIKARLEALEAKVDQILARLDEGQSGLGAGGEKRQGKIKHGL